MDKLVKDDPSPHTVQMLSLAKTRPPQASWRCTLEVTQVLQLSWGLLVRKALREVTILGRDAEEREHCARGGSSLPGAGASTTAQLLATLVGSPPPV
eukprot:3063440-Amphidinium_carterae.1